MHKQQALENLNGAKRYYESARARSEQAWRQHNANVDAWLEAGEYEALDRSARYCEFLEKVAGEAWNAREEAYEEMNAIRDQRCPDHNTPLPCTMQDCQNGVRRHERELVAVG